MSEHVELAYEEQGEGPAIILVHGFPLDRTIWRDQLQALAANGYRAIAPDLPGHGMTPAAEGGCSMEALAGAIDRLRERLGLDRVAIAGHSMGGYVALAYAGLSPERLTALALVGSRAVADSEAARATRIDDAHLLRDRGTAYIADKMLPKMFAPGTFERVPSLADAVRAVMLRADASGLAACLLGMAERPDSTAFLSRLRVPVAILAGEDDQLIPPSESIAMAAAIPGADLELIPGAGHLPMLERPGPVSAAVVRLMGLATAAT